MTALETSVHQSVLMEEILEGLVLSKGNVVVDGTIGGGGHSETICKAIGKAGTLIGLDLDRTALIYAEKRLATCPSKLILEESNYKDMVSILRTHQIVSCNAVLLDLGFSSDQLEQSGRGFSFQKNEPLLLTLSSDPSTAQFTARDIVNSWSATQIKDVLHGYGEERFAGRIAHKIVELRKEKSIATTFDLVNAIEKAVPKWYRFKRIHPATKTFQALRIAVNDEIDSLREGIQSALEVLEQSGRLVIISFHSIEDRIVKKTFADCARRGQGVVVTKKPITPQNKERQSNPRSRSAKLRIFEKAK